MKTVTISEDVYQKLLFENSKLRDVVCDIASTAPYGKHYAEAIYICKRALFDIGFKGPWGNEIEPMSTE